MLICSLKSLLPRQLRFSVTSTMPCSCLQGARRVGKRIGINLEYSLDGVKMLHGDAMAVDFRV
jgi:hypothetical protein